jgi:hypothetical protein
MDAMPKAARIARGDAASFVKLLELDPEADSDVSLFKTEASYSKRLTTKQ